MSSKRNADVLNMTWYIHSVPTPDLTGASLRGNSTIKPKVLRSGLESYQILTLHKRHRSYDGDVKINEN